MRGGPLGWVIAFFTRPIRLSDLSAVMRSLKPRAKAASEAEQGSGSAREHAAQPRSQAAGGPRPQVAMVRDTSLDVAVSEAPLDTLPAELQSEFGVTTSPTPLDTPARGGGNDR